MATARRMVQVMHRHCQNSLPKVQVTYCDTSYVKEVGLKALHVKAVVLKALGLKALHVKAL